MSGTQPRGEERWCTPLPCGLMGAVTPPVLPHGGCKLTAPAAGHGTLAAAPAALAHTSCHGPAHPPPSRDQDRYLPIANISRIMKRVLPANAKIAKDAKETVQECLSEFVSFITSE